MNNYKILPPPEWASLVREITYKDVLSITFQVTEDCCMACTYCYQHHKTNNKMSWETAKTIIDRIFSYSVEDYSTIIFEFIGGEPFMEIELIEQIMEYSINKMIKEHHPWLPFFRGSICSNGLLYNTSKVQEFLKKYNRFMNLTISVDGNKELHDNCRIDLQGNPTYDRIISAVKHYRNNYNILLDTKMTISPDNIYYLDKALINLIQENYIYIHCNCIFEKGWNYSYATLLYNKLKIIADYLLNNNLYNKIYIRFFMEDNFQPLNITENINFCGGVCKEKTTFCAINYKGKIFPCIRYMESSLNNKQPELPIGDIWNNQKEEYLSNIKLLSNITRRSQSTDECFDCPIAAGCAWCSAYNYEEFGTPNKRATYICCMHQATSLANVYYWNKLYQKLNINKQFKMNLPKEEALKIIDEEEYNYLLKLIRNQNGSDL